MFDPFAKIVQKSPCEPLRASRALALPESLASLRGGVNSGLSRVLVLGPQHVCAFKAVARRMRCAEFFALFLH
jgi:hypothetical protein